jgi:lipase maturation factor 1
MDWTPASVARWLFDAKEGASDRLVARWIFLRALGLIYFSAFFSLVFQITGLIGPDGVLPSSEYLKAVSRSVGVYERVWFAPTLLWFSAGNHMLLSLCWIGMAASLLLVFNLWPRGMLLICFVCFLSFVAAAGDFSGYQSDGMLLEAGFLALFFAPPGFRPGWGELHPPSRASLFLLQWEWFRIYFESGIVKLLSGDVQWRNFTAMDEYYQNGPLPTWIGWYVQHLPHGFHAFTVVATLVLELALVWMMFLPRSWRIVCFFIVTPWQIGVILTANYTFLNYLVLVLGFLLLDDRFLSRFLPQRWRLPPQNVEPPAIAEGGAPTRVTFQQALTLPFTAGILFLIFYVTTAQMVWMFSRTSILPTTPAAALEPFRIANQYGLFAVMTRNRYEIEFQGSDDGQNWIPYPFRFKPQDPAKAPGIYAPYQPRFDWNLWFASLGGWRQYPIVTSTEERLLSNAPEVLKLFAGNPFPKQPPKQVRAVLWQYWFTSMAEKGSQGLWWKRKMLGLYAPVLERGDDGKLKVLEWPDTAPPPE